MKRVVRFALLLIALTCAAGAADWIQKEGYRYKPVSPSHGKTGFRLLPPGATGIAFTNVLREERSIANRVLLNGSGIAAGDVDGDGLCDVYFGSLDGDNALFRNLGGWKFENITSKAGVACAGQDTTGTVFTDIDSDGDVDLLVTSRDRGLRIFRNGGKGVFEESAAFPQKTGATSIAVADIEGDGDLDLYLARYRAETIKDRLTAKFQINRVNGADVVVAMDGRPATAADLTNRFVVTPSGDVIENGEPDALFLNDGKGGFTEQSWTDGRFLDEAGRPLRDAPRDWGLAAVFYDINSDGAPDVYVCNDFSSPDRCWINDGKGSFRAISRVAIRSQSRFSMGVDFADVNRDGHVDFFVTDMLSRDPAYRHTQVADFVPTLWPIGEIENRPQMMRNTLQINRGDTTFAETAWYSGVEASDWSWGLAFLDVDLDGFEDLLIGNGQWGDFMNADMAAEIERLRAQKKMTPKEVAGMVKLYPRLATPNVAFRNNRDLTFTEVGTEWGFATPVISEAIALADLDNDGDLDVIVNNINDAAGLYENTGAANRIAVRAGVGAAIKVSGGPNEQTQQIMAGGRYLSNDDSLRSFAAGDATNLTIQVDWRSKRRSVASVPPNVIVEFQEPKGNAIVREPAVSVKPLFADVSDLINHRHVEEPFNDFGRQPLLPNRLSQGGPGIAWNDVDGDGFEDVFIGTGRGGTVGAFKNDGKGGFVPFAEEIWKRRLGRDAGGVVSFGQTVIFASSNYEDGQTNGGLVRIFSVLEKVSGESIQAQKITAGPLAMADVDADGDLDIFIGGRVVPGRYPEAADSILLSNDNGRFATKALFEKLGLITATAFTDIDADGDCDLVVAREWGAIRILRNERGRFREWAPVPGLSERSGWWNAIATGDFDNDGRMDIVASNWGLNTKYGASPRRVYFGDFDGNGVFDIVEAGFRENGIVAPERTFKSMRDSLPIITDAVERYIDYGNSSVEKILGAAFAKASVLEADTLSSMIFLNRGDHFEAAALPRDAQLAPAMGISPADFDGDGNQDIFLAQNFFATTPETFRSDAGRGLLLRGDGKGNFGPVAGQESGLLIYGEQRGCAAADYDGDGRVDLAVSQNGNRTRLYRNVQAKAGLRVRLKGGPANPSCVGARVRWANTGPAVEVQAGSGLYSQNGQVVVIARREGASELEVRWPSGKTTRHPVAGETEVAIAEP